MREIHQTLAGTLIAAAAALTTGCAQRADAESTHNPSTPAASAAVAPAAAYRTASTAAAVTKAPARPPAPRAAVHTAPDVRLEVNVARRELYVYRGGQRVETHKVAVGTRSWPTQTGSWTVGQVVWNPRWIPPREQSWAEDKAGKEPGAPDNPLGRAQLVYDAPRSVHGTNAPQSLGTAASHGSIRIANRDAVHLAKLVMEAGGAGKDPAWYKRVQANRKQRVNVGIPHPIPIRVVSGR